MLADRFGKASKRSGAWSAKTRRAISICSDAALTIALAATFAAAPDPSLQAYAQSSIARAAEDSEGDLLARGRTALEDGRAQEALEAFEAALAQDPTERQAILGRAQALDLIGRIDEAIAIYDGLLAKKAKDAPILFYRGVANYHRGQFERAEADIRAAIKGGLKLSVAHQRLGDVFYARGQLKKALEAYLTAAKAPTPHPSVHRALGNSYYALGRYRAADAAYGQALKLNPSDGYAAYYRAWTREKLGRPLLALEDYNRAFEILGGKSPRVAIDRGRILLRSGAVAAALEDFRVALDREPENPAALYGAALALIAQGQTTTAEEILNRLVAIVGDNRRLGSAALQLRARAKIVNEDYAGAVADLDLAISLNPTAAEAFYNRALARARLKDAAGALEDLTKAASLKPDDPEIQYALARAAIVAGLRDVAMKAARTAEGLAVPGGEAQLARAATLLALDKPREALRELEDMLKRAPRNVEALKLASIALMRVGRHSDALSLAHSLRLHAPRSPAGPLLEAEAYIALSKPGRARSALNRANALGAPLAKITSLAGQMWIMIAHMDPAKLPRMQVDGKWALEQAGAAYDMAVEHSKRSPETLKERASVRILRGDLKGALDDLSHAVAVRPQDADLRFARADLLRRLKRCAEAIKEYDAGLSLKPDNADARSDRADCKFDEGEYLGAVGDYVGSWF
ncbi:MAG: tetratricopeptide repeat protein [Neomegalonema sp.]|nr:tetratricopeptide repeat protein [Neomegalonema sp.]